MRGYSEEREQQARKLYEETLGYVLGKSAPLFQMTSTFLDRISCFAASLQLLGLLEVMEIVSSASSQLQAPECWSKILSHSCFYWLTYRIDWWALSTRPSFLFPSAVLRFCLVLQWEISTNEHAEWAASPSYSPIEGTHAAVQQNVI